MPSTATPSRAAPSFVRTLLSPVGIAGAAMGFAFGSHVPVSNAALISAALAAEHDGKEKPAREVFWTRMLAVSAAEVFLVLVVARMLWRRWRRSEGATATASIAAVVFVGCAVGIAAEVALATASHHFES